MGFFNLISKPQKRVMLDSSLGNVLITGHSIQGSIQVIKNYAIDAVNKGNGLVIFRDKDKGLSSYPSITSSSRIICEIDCSENSTTEQVDIFSGMSDNDVNNYILKIFNMYGEIEKSKMRSYAQYISLLRNLTLKAGKKVKMNTLVDYAIEDIEDLNYRYVLNQVEQSRNDRFLSSIRTDIRDLEAYFYDFSQNIIGNIFSGNLSLEKHFARKPIIEISLDFSSKYEESKILMSIFVEAINRCNLSLAGKNSINIVVDGVPNDVLKESGIQKIIKGGRNFNVLYTVEDISNLVEDSNEWIDYADVCFFFKQTANKNKEFCSELFGTYEKKKETYTKSTNSPTFWSAMSGRGGGTTRNKGTTVTTEKERVYLPDVFATLPDNQAIFYDKRSNEHLRLNVF